MISTLLFLMACDSPVPLPPKAGIPAPINARMVQMADFRGYLQRPGKSTQTEAILIIVDQLNETTQNQAKNYAQQEVLVIDTQASKSAAQQYLRGLSGVKAVRIVCTLPNCDEESRAVRDPIGTGG